MSRSVVVRVSTNFYDTMKKKHAREMPEVDFTEFTKMMAANYDGLFKRPLKMRVKRKPGGGMDYELDFTSL